MKIEKFGVLSGELRPFDVLLASKINDLIDVANEYRDRFISRRLFEIENHYHDMIGVVNDLSAKIGKPEIKFKTPEEMGYIKLDEESLKKFYESPEGKKLCQGYITYIHDHVITDPKIADAIQKHSERVWAERETSVAKHFQKAIDALQRIVIGEHKSESEPDMRHDPEHLGCWVNVRILAQRAMNELTLALSESGHDLKKMEEQL